MCALFQSLVCKYKAYELVGLTCLLCLLLISDLLITRVHAHSTGTVQQFFTSRV